jgi:8-oxo-dGTP pyrophosphatase MutT (NUDIX family)
MKVINMGLDMEELFAVTIVIFDEAGRILTVARKNNDNDPGLPGGKIDPGETPREAITRETFEETGFKLGRRSIEEVFRMVDDDGHLISTYLYRGNIDAAWVTEGKPEGEGYIRWCEYDELCTDKSTYKNYNSALKLQLIELGIIE